MPKVSLSVCCSSLLVVRLLAMGGSCVAGQQNKMKKMTATSVQSFFKCLIPSCLLFSLDASVTASTAFVIRREIQVGHRRLGESQATKQLRRKWR